MVTTTSTTATPTPSAASITQTAAQSLLTSLNSGSGVDTASLVTSLVQAQFAAKTAALTTKSDALTAQISGVSSLKSAITGFSSALDSLVSGGTLATQPTSSNTNVLNATALPGAKLAGVSSSITVGQLAGAQATRTMTAVSDRTAATMGSGSFTLSVGTRVNGTEEYQAPNPDYDSSDPDSPQTITKTRDTWSVSGGKSVTIDVTDGSLDSIAAAINAQRAITGVSASVVTDADGSAYLSMKGATGAAQAFTLTASAGSSDALKALTVGGSATGTSVTAPAQNAKLTVDGIAVERSSNSISDLVTGVKLDLTGVSTTAVTLGSTTPASAMTQAVADVVETYNQVLAIVTKETDPATGSLRADPAAAALLRSLKGLTLKSLVPGGGTPSTLAELGVTTNRDGTLALDSAKLATAVATAPDAIEAMFAPSANNAFGLSSVMKAISMSATSTTYGLGASESRYTSAQSDIAEAQDKIADQSEQMTTRLTQQYASMNARVSAYKSTQTFLTNQIAAWNKSDA